MDSLATLACAIALLGRAPSSFPPVHLSAEAPSHASPGVEAFVSPSRKIVVLTTTATFTDAQRSRCTPSDAMRRLASILVHEEAHVHGGSDEANAYLAQLRALLRLGVRPDSLLYRSVQHSMLTVLRREQGLVDAVGTARRSRHTMAGNQP